MNGETEAFKLKWSTVVLFVLGAMVMVALTCSGQPLTVDPLVTVADPEFYCTKPAFYVTDCEVPISGPQAVYVEMFQSAPGHHSQFCSGHSWIVDASDGFRYAIIDQGAYDPAHGKFPRIWPEPPLGAEPARSVWIQCVMDRVSPAGSTPTAGNYHCDGSVPLMGGTETYRPVLLSGVLNAASKRSFTTLFHCGAIETQPPSPTKPSAPPPGTATPARAKTATPKPGPCVKGQPCNHPTLTATRSPIRTAVPPTATGTSTPGPLTPAPVGTVVPRPTDVPPTKVPPVPEKTVVPAPPPTPTSSGSSTVWIVVVIALVLGFAIWFFGHRGK
jgi:hypothetical protein